MKNQNKQLLQNIKDILTIVLAKNGEFSLITKVVDFLHWKGIKVPKCSDTIQKSFDLFMIFTKKKMII